MPSAEEEPAVRIEVLEARCQGHARCATLAPELFDLDEEGYGLVRPGCERVVVGSERYENALRAAENCPEEAIRIESEA